MQLIYKVVIPAAPIAIGLTLYLIFEHYLLKTMATWPSSQIPSYILKVLCLSIVVLSVLALRYFGSSKLSNQTLIDLRKENDKQKELCKLYKEQIDNMKEKMEAVEKSISSSNRQLEEHKKVLPIVDPIQNIKERHGMFPTDLS